MVSQISFTGTYKVDNQNPDSFSKFQSYASRKEIQEGVRTIFEDKIVKGKTDGNACIILPITEEENVLLEVQVLR